MVTSSDSGLFPGSDTDLADRRRRIVAYWNVMSVCEDSGGTTWDVLDRLRTKITELLERGRPEDILLADRLTAKAEWYRWFDGDD